MKSRLVIAFLLTLASAGAAMGQDHLIPDTGQLAKPDDYKSKVRYIFARAFAQNVPVRVIVSPSFKAEYAVGLRVPSRRMIDLVGTEILVLDPSAPVWDSHLLEILERSRAECREAGEAITPREEDMYRELKSRAPADYREISVKRHARVIPADLALKITSIWEDALLGVRHPKEPIVVEDGDRYDFSGTPRPRRFWGTLSGHVDSPEADSQTGRLVALVETMADYARGQADLDTLRTKVEAVEDGAKKLP